MVNQSLLAAERVVTEQTPYMMLQLSGIPHLTLSSPCGTAQTGNQSKLAAVHAWPQQPGAKQCPAYCCSSMLAARLVHRAAPVPPHS